MKIHLSQLVGAVVTFDAQVEESPGVYTFRFRPHPGLTWEGGQYYVYFMPKALLDPRLPLRPFSVATSPQEGHLQITTRIGSQVSPFKSALMQLKPGAKVIAAGPYGFFQLKDEATHHVFLVGGIGITAVRSLLADHAARGPLPQITLLYSNRDQHVLFKDELDAWATQFPQFKPIYVTDPERIDPERVKKEVPDLAAATFYISGPKPMVIGLGQSLETELHVAKEAIVHDAFKGYPWPLT